MQKLIIGLLARRLCIFLGIVLARHGLPSLAPDIVTWLSGALAIVVGVVWGLVQKIREHGYDADCWQRLLAGMTRSGLDGLAGWLVDMGVTNGVDASTIVGALAGIGSIGWSIAHKTEIAVPTAEPTKGPTFGGPSQIMPLLIVGVVLGSLFCCSTYAADGGAAVPPTNTVNESLLSLLMTAATNTPAQAASPALNITVNPKLAQAVDGLTWLQALGKTTTIGGVETFLDNGEYGSGVAIAWQPIHADIKARTRLFFGPALVTASTRQATRELLEAALETKVVDATAVQAAFKKIWLIGQLPIDISEAQLFLGFGARVDADTSTVKAFTRYLGGSGGVTGIKWGN